MKYQSYPKSSKTDAFEKLTHSNKKYANVHYNYSAEILRHYLPGYNETTCNLFKKNKLKKSN